MMKEDYLWDKTGSDPEIEKLENALQVFRYKETAPPELPAKIVAFPVQSGRKVFRFALAAAACLAFGTLALGVWFQILKNNMEPNPATAELNKPQSKIPPKINPVPPDVIAVSSAPEAENSVKVSAPKIARTPKATQAAVRQKDLKSQGSKQTKAVVRLTEEEKFAYNQLMIALSITGSKLKIVKDKVEGFDENTAAVEKGR